MFTTGHLKLKRIITTKSWYSKANEFNVMMHLLMEANFTDSDTIKRGQILVNYQDLARHCGLTYDMIRNAFRSLGASGEVRIRKVGRMLLVTLCNYGAYQDDTHDAATIEPQSDHNQTTIQPPFDQNKTKEKNTGNKKEKKDTIVSKEKLELPYNSDAFVQTWRKLIATKKWSKKSISALQVSLKRLADYEEPFAILLMEEAIEHDWQGVVFDATPERYRKWKDAQTPSLPFSTAPTAPTTAATNPDSIWEDGRFYTLADFQSTEEGRKLLGRIEGEWQEKVLAEEGGLLRHMGIWEPLSDHPEYAKQNNK